MGNVPSRVGILVGATAGALGAALIMSAATASPARADDFSALITDLNEDVSGGPAAFQAAYTDFLSDQFAPGLAQLFAGVDDYTLGPNNTLILATAEILSGDSVNSSWSYGFLVPQSFADAESVAQSYFTGALTDFGLAANDFSTGDYVFGTLNDVLAVDYSSIMPLEELLIGAATSF
jgi:hypothetical protein